MANRVPNRLCHLSPLNKKQNAWAGPLSRGVQDQVGRLPTVFQFISSPRLAGVPQHELPLKPNGAFFNSKTCVVKTNELHCILNTFPSPVTLFAESEGQRFLSAATTKRQRAITKQPKETSPRAFNESPVSPASGNCST